MKAYHLSNIMYFNAKTNICQTVSISTIRPLMSFTLLCFTCFFIVYFILALMWTHSYYILLKILLLSCMLYSVHFCGHVFVVWNNYIVGSQNVISVDFLLQNIFCIIEQIMLKQLCFLLSANFFFFSSYGNLRVHP